MLLRHALVAALIVAIVSVAMLFNEFHAYSGDSGLHYALVRALMDPVSGPSPDTLGLMGAYPPVAHWMAAGVGRFTGSGLLGMTVVVSVAVALFYLAMFIMAFQVNWRAAAIAFVMTAAIALLRGPLFGRMTVNNYFYGQAIGSSIMVLTLFVAWYRFHKWRGLVIDAFVLASSQIIVATHLMPAAQLVATYCFILLVQGWTRMCWKIFARLCLFAALALILTANNKYAVAMYGINQAPGGAHINLIGEPILQIVFLALASYAAVKLVLISRTEEGAGLFLGSMGLGTCAFALMTMGLTWIGFGTVYSIDKCMFMALAVFIFVIAANIAKQREKPAEPSWSGSRLPGSRSGLVWCAILALLATRVDMFPSVVNLKAVRPFEAAVVELSATSNADGPRSIALASIWPPNIAFGITYGDLHMPLQLADHVLFDKPLPQDQVRFAFMPPNDPALARDCIDVEHSNANAVAMDYGCFLRAKTAKQAR